MDAAAKSQSAALHSSLRYNITALVGPDHVHPTSASDTIAGVLPKLAVVPGTEKELTEVLRLSNEAGLAVIPRGRGTKLAWGNPPSRADLIFSTARLGEIIEHAWADLTVTVQAGCTFQKLQETLAQHGQRLALDPLWPGNATIGGVLSTNDSGALRLRFGSLRDLIIGVTVALPDGTLASSGGKVVKNVAGYDLPKLLTGAFGTLGIITRAIFRLHPLPHHTRSFTISTANPEEAQKLVLAVQDSKLAHTALQSHFSAGIPPTTDILFEGTEAGLDAQAAQLRDLCSPAKVSEASSEVWKARQELYSTVGRLESPSALAKISSLPVELARIVELFRLAGDSYRLHWSSLIYATGLGCLLLKGPADNLQRSLTNLRRDLEKKGGSLVLLHRPAELPAFDTWGSPGDSLPLMKAIRQQLDPKTTLNPGRFVGGI